MYQKIVVSARQIKAARALLDWSQEDLAKATTLSIATIRKLEVGNISSRGKTNDLIRESFWNAGLEFINPSGVRQRLEEIKVYQGEDGAKDFWDDVYETSHRTSMEVVQVWPSLRQMVKLIGTYKLFHIERMMSLKDRVPVKCILTEDDEFMPAPYVEYRFFSRLFVDSVQFYVYGDKFAIIPFSTDDKFKIIVIQSRAAAESFRCQFKSMWERSSPIKILHKEKKNTKRR